ncbi:MAG TPA: 2-dehydropantoate 2-reductase [Spirochaetia bacterium]|nr:2-dehydropantoate 2-reductase [Spirochaetia bacterium]
MIQTIWIYGTGGVGGFIGGKILKTLQKENENKIKVYFIARGVHMEEIKKNGLILNTADEKNSVVKPDGISDDPSDFPAPDLCFICVKSYDLEAVSLAIAAKMKETTKIIPLLNGIDIYERLRKSITKGKIYPACIYVGTHIEKPGVVTQKGGEGKILFGEDPAYPDETPQDLLYFINHSGLSYQWFDNPYPPIWEKYIFIAGFGLVSAYKDKTLDEIMEDENLRKKTEKIMTEIYEISVQKKIDLPHDIVAVSLMKGALFPKGTKTSYQRDVEQGAQNEGELFGDTIIRLGSETGVDVSVTKKIVELMHLKK